MKQPFEILRLIKAMLPNNIGKRLNFATKMEIKPSNLDTYTQGTSRIPFSFILKMFEVFPESKEIFFNIIKKDDK